MKKASQLPRRYYGLHMVEGVAQYQEKGKEPFKILINEKVLKEMNQTFEGKPVFVNHIKGDIEADAADDADGVVVKSFYNEVDGKYWCEFMVVSDDGHQAIAKGWKLSNAYIQKGLGAGGEWHAIPYQNEIRKGEYEHLAIVESPRYTESVIYTPEQFKTYNETKRAEIKKFANEREKVETKKQEPSMFKFFKKTKLENSIETDLNEIMVEIGTKKEQMSVESALKLAEKFVNMAGYANDDHMAKVDDEEMSVNDLKNAYKAQKAKMKNMIDKPAEDDKKENADEDKKDDDKKENEEDDKKDGKKENGKKKENAADKSEDQKVLDAADVVAQANFKKLMNAHGGSEQTKTAYTMADAIKRGKDLY